MNAIVFLGALLLADGAAKPACVNPATERQYLAGFDDGASHWKKKRDVSGEACHDPAKVREIAENVLALQRSNGGWPPNEHVTRVLTDEERNQWLADRAKADTSFDNRTTYTHVRYLAHAYDVTKDKRFRDAALRGLGFIFQAERPHGGWPHSYPRPGSYYPRVTFMDDVTIGVLTTLREAAEGRGPFGWLDTATRARCQQAVERGERCLLDLQLKVNDKRTIWAGQYDEKTLAPAPGRTFEPIALTASESVGVVRYLMALPKPSAEVVASIEAAVQWYRDSTLAGFRVERVAAEEVKFDNHTSRFDIVQVADPSAPPLWARFYDIKTNQPVLQDRDGRRVARLADMSRERRTGYSWFGPYGRELLARDYPTWTRRISRNP